MLLREAMRYYDIIGKMIDGIATQRNKYVVLFHPRLMGEKRCTFHKFAVHCTVILRKVRISRRVFGRGEGESMTAKWRIEDGGGDGRGTREHAGSEKEELLLVDKLVRSVGLILRNTEMRCWLSSYDKRQAVGAGYALLNQLLEASGRVNFKLTDGVISINGEPVLPDNLIVGNLVKHLADREIYDFSFDKGLVVEEFERVLDLISKTPEQLEAAGGCVSAAGELDISGFTVRNVVYREVAEDQLVIDKDKIAKKLLSDKDAEIDHIIAFLRGETASLDAKLDKRIYDISADTGEMLELIIGLVDIERASASLADGESLAGVLVGSLRRIFGNLIKTRAVKTQQGRKRLKQTLGILEEELLKTLNIVSEGKDVRAEQAVRSVIEDMRDELQVDTLSTDYMKKRKAIEESEKRLLRYIRKYGSDDIDKSMLKGKLENEGLSDEEWRDLTRRIYPGSSSVLSGEEILTSRELEGLLARMRSIDVRMDSSTKRDAENALMLAAAEVRSAVEQVADSTHQKIQLLTDELKGDCQSKTVKSDHLRMSRARIIEVLAEIVQELCQPLSVISCSLEMVMSGSTGDVTEAQAAMLKLANESAWRITMLKDSLKKIAGDPRSLKPDVNITSSFY